MLIVTYMEMLKCVKSYLESLMLWYAVPFGAMHKIDHQTVEFSIYIFTSHSHQGFSHNFFSAVFHTALNLICNHALPVALPAQFSFLIPLDPVRSSSKMPHLKIFGLSPILDS
jgi:hypothetical protein